MTTKKTTPICPVLSGPISYLKDGKGDAIEQWSKLKMQPCIGSVCMAWQPFTRAERGKDGRLIVKPSTRGRCLLIPDSQDIDDPREDLTT